MGAHISFEKKTEKSIEDLHKKINEISTRIDFVENEIKEIKETQKQMNEKQIQYSELYNRQLKDTSDKVDNISKVLEGLRNVFSFSIEKSIAGYVDKL